MSETRLGAAVVIEYPAGSDAYVLIEETKKPKIGLLNLAGGRVKKRESVYAGAVREAKEETGLDVELTGFLGLFVYAKDCKTQLVFAARAIGGQLQPSEEHPSVESYTFEFITGTLAPEGRLRSTRVLDAIGQYREREGQYRPGLIRIAETDHLPYHTPKQPTEILLAA